MLMVVVGEMGYFRGYASKGEDDDDCPLIDDYIYIPQTYTGDCGRRGLTSCPAAGSMTPKRPNSVPHLLDSIVSVIWRQQLAASAINALPRSAVLALIYF